MKSTRRGFLIGAAAVGGAALSRRVAAVLTGRSMTAYDALGTIRSAQSAITHGPLVGHLTSTSAMVWARCSTLGVYHLTAHGIGEREELVATAEATPENDMCVVWRVTGLQAETRYGYEATYQDQPILSDEDTFFVTPTAEEAPTLTRLAFGSCARENPGSSAVWRRMSAMDPHAVVLLGDTPYIDSTALDVQRTRYGEFAAVPDFADLLRNRPLYATWDDHDFGANDTDGRLPGKANARRAFIEYHANPSYGDGNQGIYTKFRRGGATWSRSTRSRWATTRPPRTCARAASPS